VTEIADNPKQKSTRANPHKFRNGLIVSLVPFLFAILLMYLNDFFQIPSRIALATGGSTTVIDAVLDAFYVLLSGIISGVLVSQLIVKSQMTKEALGESKQSLSEEITRRVKLFDQTPVGILIIDPKTARFLEFNTIAHRQLGYTREEFARLGIHDVEADENSREVQKRMALVMCEGMTDFDARQRTKQGEIRNIHVTAQLVHISGTAVFQCIWQDITDRKVMENLLRVERDHARRLLDVAGVMIITLDSNAKVTMVNRKASEILECGTDQIIGKDWLNCFIPERARGDAKAALESMFSGGAQPAVYNEIPILTSSGQERMIAWNNSIIRDESGKIIEVVASGQDLTDRLKSESEKQSLRQRAELAGRLASVGEMAAGFAHEINNPLTGIIGFTEMLKERNDLPPEVVKDVNIIADGARRVSDIVRRILTFSRHTKAMRVPSDLNSLIESTLSLQTYALKTGNIEVVTEFEKNLPLITADQGQLQQVFINLIVNAEHAMKNGGRLTISSAVTGGSIRIIFKDTGHGIPPDIMGKIFDPFYTTKPKGEGTGLGLSLSHSIIREHGGDIFAESEPGKGAAFIIDLPVSSGISVDAPRGSAPPVPGKYNGHASILVVDDEPQVRTLLTNVLEKSGISVDAAGTPEDALFKVARNTYDLLILDLRLPGMNGADLYQHILDVSPIHTGRVMFITGYVGEDGVRSELEALGAPLVLKPFDMDKFINQIEGLLSTGRS
jgi:PAS domain S-box-containing protein